MDVTGNNIANVNTTGFKAGRVSFKESMAQLLRGSSRPPGNAGGTNPMQLGLGMAVGSIDTMLVQGNLQSTGKITDLALEGTGYLVYSSGEGDFYSRNGALQMDSTGRLVSPTNGFMLQGMVADSNGNYPPGSRIGDIRIPFGEKAPARNTSIVQYGCNLDSDSEGLGTIAHSNRFLSSVAIPAASAGTATLTSLYDAQGNSLGIRAGDVISVAAEGVAAPRSITVTDTTTLNDLLANAIRPVLTAVSPADAATLQADGTIRINAAGAPVNNLRISSNRPTSNSQVATVFNWGPSVTTIADSTALRRPAMETDNITDLYDAAGNTLGLESGDEIRVNGDIGGQAIPTQTAYFLAVPAGAPAGSVAVATMQDLANLIQGSFNLPQFDGTMYNNVSVSVNDADTPDDRIPDGSVAIRGQAGATFSLNNISITATNSNLNNISPTRLNANMTATEIQHARDVGQHSTSITVYDESGDAHVMTTTFTHSGIPGEWLWEITTEGGESILGGNTGRITFGQDGTPSSFTFDDNSTAFRFDPMNGSNVVVIRLDAGSPGSFSGITQFRSPSTTAAKFQDGYPMGKLQDISIDEYGEINGLYTNGVTKSIARIYVAEFNNPAGLFKKGDSMYSTSNNSGEAVMLRPGIGTSTKVKPGALEMSNVELATEFTNMITTQRGYQANARVITTSDNMLQELVQLVR
jgi:flagellar hook protein FlgE